MKLSKNQISAQAILLAASIFIGSNSFVLAAPQANGTGDKAESKPTVSAAGVNATQTTANQAAATKAASNSNTTMTSPAAKTSSAAEASATGIEAGKSAVPTGPGTNTGAPAIESTVPSTANPGKWRPGMELSIGTDTQDLVPTDDPELARKQVEAYPDSPEAAFILAVALTRTSKVEEALQEVRRARKLADQKGAATYFDKMIGTYEDLLKNYPKENRVRYGLAWAYYMKAYLLASYSRKVAKWKAANPDPAKALAATANANSTIGAQLASANAANNNAVNAAKAAYASAAKSGKPLDIGALLGQASALAQGNPGALPKIPEFTDGVEAQDIPQIRKYFEQALSKMDELIAQKPDDVWALVYRAHLKAEYTGNIDEAMKTWKACSEKFPNNPAAYFFLGEGYLKKGDLKASINNVSKAVALRGLGN